MSQQTPKKWEFCTDPNSFTGTHQWHIEERYGFNQSSGMAKNDSKKYDMVVCKVCKVEPPNLHKGRIMKEITDNIEQDKEVRRIRNLYRPGSRRR